MKINFTEIESTPQNISDMIELANYYLYAAQKSIEQIENVNEKELLIACISETCAPYIYEDCDLFIN